LASKSVSRFATNTESQTHVVKTHEHGMLPYTL
jgi:hypothetical protein